MNKQIYDLVQERKEKLLHYRRDFHKHAETAWTEFRTASIVADTQSCLYQVFLHTSYKNERSAERVSPALQRQSR